MWQNSCMGADQATPVEHITITEDEGSGFAALESRAFFSREHIFVSLLNTAAVHPNVVVHMASHASLHFRTCVSCHHHGERSSFLQARKQRMKSPTDLLLQCLGTYGRQTGFRGTGRVQHGRLSQLGFNQLMCIPCMDTIP